MAGAGMSGDASTMYLKTRIKSVKIPVSYGASHTGTLSLSLYSQHTRHCATSNTNRTGAPMKMGPTVAIQGSAGTTVPPLVVCCLSEANAVSRLGGRI